MADRWKPSVTVAAIASRPRSGVPDAPDEYLLVEEHTAEGLRLNNPAGHLEPGESLLDAVVRETLEETTRELVVDRLVGLYLARSGHADTTYLRFAFAGRVGIEDRSRALDDGIVGTLWMTIDELRASQARHRSPLLLRCVEDAAAGCAVPLDRLVTDPSVHAPEDSPPEER